ncbi:MAG: hypothetical protein Q4C48_02890 [Lachnospiraceae bacterium]|nr:hypothetical protein [Lachnospiraceae bacterium]
MEEFILVKQMTELYALCQAAEQARSREEHAECAEQVKRAFVWMAQSVCQTAETEPEALKQLLSEAPLLTDRSRATYIQYAAPSAEHAGAMEAEIAYESLVEEVSKFAKYYCKGETPQSTQEIAEQYADGKNSTRSGRNRADDLFRGLVLALLGIVGVLMVLLSVFVSSLSHLLVGGVVVLLFGFLFYTIGSRIEK